MYSDVRSFNFKLANKKQLAIVVSQARQCANQLDPQTAVCGPVLIHESDGWVGVSQRVRGRRFAEVCRLLVTLEKFVKSMNEVLRGPTISPDPGDAELPDPFDGLTPADVSADDLIRTTVDARA